MSPRSTSSRRPKKGLHAQIVSARRRRFVLGGLALVVGVAGAWSVLRDEPLLPHEVRGSSAWALVHYGNPDSKRFEERNIVAIEFLGRTMFVHRKAKRHFLRLARIFEARAPEYAAGVPLGTLDDWSYHNRNIRGELEAKSNHAFGIAVDVNALTNVLTTEGDMPREVVDQWEREGGDWGGDWSRADPMHFETHLTPAEIRERYNADGTPTDEYLEELVG